MTKRIEWPFKYVERGNKESLLYQVKECASLFCRIGETARILGCTAKAFSRRLEYDEELIEAWEDGLASASKELRKTQLELAKKAPGMAIFLGKNYLGQVDEPKVKSRDDDALKRQLSELPPEKLLQIQKILQEAKNEASISGEVIVEKDSKLLTEVSGADK